MANVGANRDELSKATIDEVNRLLEIGKLLAAVLSPEEIEQIDQAFNLIVSIDISCSKTGETINSNR